MHTEGSKQATEMAANVNAAIYVMWAVVFFVFGLLLIMDPGGMLG